MVQCGAWGMGWMAAGVLLFFFIVALNFWSKKLNHSTTYAVCLLLDDGIRADHKRKLEEWIRQSGARDAMELSSHVYRAVGTMGETMGGEGKVILGVHSMIWGVKKAAS